MIPVLIGDLHEFFGFAGGGEGLAGLEAGAPRERVERVEPAGQGAIDFFLQALSAGRRS